ncbi:uncharacterized protein DEA37_0000915 [Paragonimus westermani]|uniref:DFDF domain-containing protein n=1 Tax=Paragonimus westermani TaxID=34504 RepID=A0A5J4NML3_9TREM|nr:uncharacterized protein DEA37_0000915 [Paragonimus westermani]
MQCQYIGFRVKITSSELGDVVGTVVNVTEDKLELSNALINDQGSSVPTVAVESRFIQNLRILATGSGDSSDDITPKKDCNRSTNPNGGRAQRREMLRNIPNACCAYVCPESPPLIHRSMGYSAGSSCSPRQKGLQRLDSALAGISISDKPSDRYTSKGYKTNTPGKRRSYSMSEATASSEVSGTESGESFHRDPNHHVRTHMHMTDSGGGRFHGPNGNSQFSRSGCPVSNRFGGCSGGGSVPNRTQPKALWDQIRVEDFMDEDFDFEKNLALFDKRAFCGVVDTRNGVTSKQAASAQPVSSSKPLDEGPDGVGVPLIGTIRHSERTPVSKKKDYYDDCTMTTNTATLSSAKQRYDHSVPNYHPSSQPPVDATTNLTVCNCSNTVCTAHPSHSLNMAFWYWYSPNGLRVPVLSVDDHSRMLHYLATGIDTHAQLLNANSASRLAQGLSWGRVLETAGRSLVDHITGQLRQSGSTPQRTNQRPPARVLVLPDGPNLSGAFAVTLARLLATRGACVLLVAPKPTIQPDETPDLLDGSLGSVYRTELDLATQLAPRPNPYGLEEDGQFESQVAEEEGDDDEDEGVDDDGATTTGSEFVDLCNINSHSDVDSDLASRLTPDRLSNVTQDTLDYSPLNRMWISRMPGVKLLRRTTTVTKLPPNVRVDLVILGHRSENHEPNDRHPAHSQLVTWLRNHRALGRVIHLQPRCVSLVNDQYALRNASANCVVELGLPKLLPSPSQPDSLFHSASTTHLLVDVGLSRSLIRRLTGDLKLLPPYGLFDSGSVIGLRTVGGSTVGSTP